MQTPGALDPRGLFSDHQIGLVEKSCRRGGRQLAGHEGHGGHAQSFGGEQQQQMEILVAAFDGRHLAGAQSERMKRVGELGHGLGQGGVGNGAAVVDDGGGGGPFRRLAKDGGVGHGARERAWFMGQNDSIFRGLSLPAWGPLPFRTPLLSSAQPTHI